VSGIIVDVFAKIARLGMTKAAAFFYAVAVGVSANLVFEYVHRHDAALALASEPAAITEKPVSPPIATALIAPKAAAPNAPLPTLLTSAPAITLTPAAPNPPPTTETAASAPPPKPEAATPPSPEATASVVPPNPATPNPSTAPSDATASAAAAPSALAKPSATPSTETATPAALPIETALAPASTSTPPEPISLLPPQAVKPASIETTELPPPKPATPGPGSGGLY